ncbi:MAG: nucleotidyltransferase domain-containing protein [Betaproteobacteria bacterium]|jgi:predicted nucleotidyltransferase
MISPQQLQSVADRIVERASSSARVILFGSYARGDASEDSDIDLLVVETELRDKASEYLQLKSAVGRVGVGVDLIVMSDEEFERRRHVPGTLPYWAAKEGQVLR